MSIDILSGLATVVVALIVLGVLGFGLVLVRDGKLAWGAAVMLCMTGSWYGLWLLFIARPFQLGIS